MKIGTDLAGKDLRGDDLREADLTGQSLYATDLRGASLLDASISVNCSTFHRVKLDDRQVGTFLLLLSQADTKHASLLRRAAHEVFGDHYWAMLRMMDIVESE